MAFSDWDIYSTMTGTSPSVTCVTDALHGCPPVVYAENFPATGIYGGEAFVSYRFDGIQCVAFPCYITIPGLGLSDPQTTVVQTANLVTQTFASGFYAGTMYGYFSLEGGFSSPAQAPNLQSPYNFGLLCMQSQRNMHGSGEAYALMFDGINFSNRYRLCKVTGGLSLGFGAGPGSNYTVLAESAPHAWDPSPTFYTISSLGTTRQYGILRLSWWSDPYFLKGTYLKGSYVSGTDGSGNPIYTTVGEIVHTGPGALSTLVSAGEGPYAAGATNYGGVICSGIFTYKTTITRVNGVAYPP